MTESSLPRRKANSCEWCTPKVKCDEHVLVWPPTDNKLLEALKNLGVTHLPPLAPYGVLTQRDYSGALDEAAIGIGIGIDGQPSSTSRQFQLAELLGNETATDLQRNKPESLAAIRQALLDAGYGELFFKPIGDADPYETLRQLDEMRPYGPSVSMSDTHGPSDPTQELLQRVLKGLQKPDDEQSHRSRED